MTPLDNLLHRLYELGELKRSEETGDIHSYSYTYFGRIAHQRVVINPTMEKKCLRQIIGRAMEGSLTDIATVSMMYNVGYGLPKDLGLSEVWAQYATVSPAVLDFDTACAELKSHYRACPKIIWPEGLTFPVERVYGTLGRFKPFADKMRDVCITPVFAGVRVLLLYRKVSKEAAPQLYGAYYQDGGMLTLNIEALTKLGAPKFLEGMPQTKAVDSFVPFGKSRLIVVTGVVAIPTKLHKNARRFGKTTKDVFNALLADLGPRKTEAAFDNSYYVDQLRVFRKRIRKLEAKLKTVKRLRRVIFKAELEKAVDQYAALKVALEKSNPETEYANYLESLPESYLQLVTTGQYEWKRGELVVSKLAATTPSKQIALHGLTELANSSLRFAAYRTEKRIGEDRLRQLAAKFEEACGFKVTGLIVQPQSETPLLKSCRIFTH